MKINAFFIWRNGMLSFPSLCSLECFLLILTFFSAQLFPPTVIAHITSLQVWNLHTKLLFSGLTKTPFRVQSFHPFKDTYRTKGHGLQSVDSQTPPAPATSQQQNALCYENDERSPVGWSCVILTARRWELCWVYIFLQRGSKTRWFSPASQVTSYISELLKAIAVSSCFYCPSLITAPSCKSLPRRLHYLLCLPGHSPSLEGDGSSVSGGSWGPVLLPHLSFCRERSKQKGP